MSSDQERLWQYVETWHAACADLVALARELPEDEWHLPTDLAGWDVHANVAHTAHLEAILAGRPEETIEVAPAPHVVSPMGAYTEQGVLARRDRSMAELADEIEHAVEVRLAELRADPPTDPAAPPRRIFAGSGWSTELLLKNRPLDVWMHSQDVRRATGRPGGWDLAAARHTIDYLADSWPVVVGKRVAPPVGTCVALAVPEVDVRRCVAIGEDGRARPSEKSPDVRIVLEPEAFVLLAGGRRKPGAVEAEVEGDAGLGARVLDAMAVTP